LKLQQIYKGVMPFVAIQIAVLALIIAYPSIALWLPTLME
jgi:TRAP-type mannitol/chloroaromatic compound transport system permease large subunit